MAKVKVVDVLQPMVDWGLIVDGGRDGTDGNEAVADCPACGKKRHLYINPDTGAFNCKRCDFSGNPTTYLEWVHSQLLESTTDTDLKRIAVDWKLPVTIFRLHDVAFDKDSGLYVLPTKNERGRIIDLRKWKPGSREIKGTWGAKTGLWNLDALASLPMDGGPVHVAEGEKDGLALDYARRKGKGKGVVVALPGATTLKKEWLAFFAGREVVWYFDADDAGDKGAKKATDLTSTIVKRNRFVVWPGDVKEGFDARDFITQGIDAGYSGAEVWKKLRGMESVGPRTDPAAAKTSAGKASSNGHHDPEDDKTATWKQTLRTFHEYIELTPDLEAAAKVMFAVALSAKFQDNDPLWAWLVGPPSSGKTLLAMSLAESPQCEFVSSLTPNTLVSGFQSNVDPSLIPKLIGRCLVVKEGTQILQLPQMMQDQVFSILRDAYDGKVNRPYGNGVTRNYIGRFSFFGAVTNAIHGNSQASLGERCLKFQLEPQTERERESILDNVFDEADNARARDEAMQKAARRFLNRPFPEVADITSRVPRKYRERLKGLATLVAWVRSTVPRDKFRRDDLAYRPMMEAPTRVLSQLFRLSGLLAYVVNEDELAESTYRIVERVAFDTAIGWHMEIVSVIAAHDATKGWLRGEVCEALHLPSSSVYEQLEDLVLKGMLIKRPGEGKQKLYHLADDVLEQWERSGVAPETALPAALRAAKVRRKRKKEPE